MPEVEILHERITSVFEKEVLANGGTTDLQTKRYKSGIELQGAICSIMKLGESESYLRPRRMRTLLESLMAVLSKGLCTAVLDRGWL